MALQSSHQLHMPALQVDSDHVNNDVRLLLVPPLRGQQCEQANVRFTFRLAATALAVSLLVFCLALMVAVAAVTAAPTTMQIAHDSSSSSGSGGSGGGTTAFAGTLIGLVDEPDPVISEDLRNNKTRDALESVMVGYRAILDDFDHERSGSTCGYHVVTNSTLRTAASSHATFVRNVTNGTAVVPLAYRDRWVQVFVSEGADSLHGAFGWLPEEVAARGVGTAAIAERGDLGSVGHSDARKAKTWDDLREENKRLMRALGSAQAAYVHRPTSHAASHSKRAGNPNRNIERLVSRGAKEVINAGELRKMVRTVRDGIHDELDKGPAKVMKDFSKFFET
eukprot:CAMPEP_0115394998 /NCGR_PEP_ID=MMETSP0271-20121206/12560_1 /TAXON_ID=71861 /ORGANISM="Scrippsiella trochoidea, Strain CCMP3099" /LENGTH=336 /DNA_ID=CAMNT_0002818697 /DNA_START=37 /DNA_END=1047 /DNA_ORIENTATION=+